LKLTRIDSSLAQPDTTRKGYFEGEVKTLQLVGTKQSNEIELLAVYFSAGARTIPHIHKQDQVLQIIEGRGIVATETEKLQVSAGDIITIPAGIWHWHGATRNTAMCHISIKRPGPTDWEVEMKNWESGYDEVAE
jgi:quercetin dioxygenase-like cupin family protein